MEQYSESIGYAKEMRRYREPIGYAKEICNVMMKKFKAEDLPPKGIFHYHQGVFLSGMQKTYALSGEEKYQQYIKDWVDSIIDEQGDIHTFNPGQLDDIMAGILLYPLLDLTGDERYQKALDTLLPIIYDFPRNEAGGFWHKEWHPHQMWLDGLYMAGPISAEYGKRCDRPEYTDLVIEQALLMIGKTRDENTGLLYHAWDCSKQQPWADPVTGLSSEFWGRSIGWVPVALLDDLDHISREHPGYARLCDAAADLLAALVRFQSQEGRWYQVVDKGHLAGNWLENSCSCLYVAALCKAMRKGLISSDYIGAARRGFEAVIDTLTWKEGEMQLGDVCVGTGVGDYQYYCERPTSANDLHGVGAFLIMCTEAQLAGLHK